MVSWGKMHWTDVAESKSNVEDHEESASAVETAPSLSSFSHYNFNLRLWLNPSYLMFEATWNSTNQPLEKTIPPQRRYTGHNFVVSIRHDCAQRVLFFFHSTDSYSDRDLCLEAHSTLDESGLTYKQHPNSQICNASIVGHAEETARTPIK